MFTKTSIFALLVLLCRMPAMAQTRQAPALLPPDARYKADLLLIVAHPDDDVVIGGYLARASLDQHKRIAVIYCTPGDGGGNAVGNEAGAALGQMRILEARRALAPLGIDNVWFLGGHDTPGQDPLRSLDRWGHGRMLEEVVRLVRLTRPEVIVTWLPNYVVGENHGDHQAAGVLATEAFDAAGDPTQFSEQVWPASNRTGMSNLTEGLHPWQTKKLYFATDAFEDFGPYWHNSRELSPFRENFLDGQGPTYSNTEESPSRHKSYARLNADQQLFYLTQEAALAQQAFAANDLRQFEYPMRLLFGKSLVGGSITGDIFEGIRERPAPYSPVPGWHAAPEHGITFHIGGPWAYYRDFWQAHTLPNIARLLPVPEASVGLGRTLSVPIFLHNTTSSAITVNVTAKLPPDWVDRTRYQSYPVQPGETYPVRMEVVAPPSGEPRWQELSWTAEAQGKPVGSLSLRVFVAQSNGMEE